MTLRPVVIQGLDRPLTPLILGSGMGMPTKEEELFFDLLDRYTALGGNAVDTGTGYGRGRSKESIARWLSRGKNSEKLLVIDKGCHPHHDAPRVTPEAVHEDVSISVERLGRPIDLFMFHRDNVRVPVGPLMEAVNDEIARGRVRAIGASNWTVERIQEANTFAADRGWRGLACSSPNLSLARPRYPIWPKTFSSSETDLVWHAQTGFPLLSWSAQSMGFFCGKYAPDRDADEWFEDIYYTPANFERLRRAKELAGKKGVTPNQTALAWIFHHPFPVAGIVGLTTPQEMTDSFGALQVELTQEEFSYLDEVKD